MTMRKTRQFNSVKNLWLPVVTALLVFFGLIFFNDSAYAQITDSGAAINKAGRQRMLSQRIAKFQQALEWQVGDANARTEIDKARSEFIKAQTELKRAVQNTPEIRDELELAEMQWIFFDNAIQSETSSSKKAAPANVATTSERILGVMDHVTGLYEKLKL